MTGIPNGAAGTTLCVDFDGTLFPWEELDGDSPPNYGAVEFMLKAKERGYRIVIFTSRLSPTWIIEQCGEYELPVEFNRQKRMVAERLRKHGIPFDDLTSEKVPARYYIDDRAIEFKGDWHAVAERIW